MNPGAAIPSRHEMEPLNESVRWCIVHDPGPPSEISEPVWNMALDSFNLDCVVRNRSVARMRLYQWSGPAITLGKFQDPGRSVNIELCRDQDIPIARRPTGGRGILHGSDLTVSLAISLETLGLNDSTSITDIYGSLSAALLAAFASVGLKAARGCCQRPDRGHSADCMATVSRADIVLASSGVKLLGAALLRRTGCVLLQCTIPANADSARWQRLQSAVFSGPAMCAPLAPIVSLRKLRAALVNEMRSRLGAPPELYELDRIAVQQVIDRSVEHQIAI